MHIKNAFDFKLINQKEAAQNSGHLSLRCLLYVRFADESCSAQEKVSCLFASRLRGLGTARPAMAECSRSGAPSVCYRLGGSAGGVQSPPRFRAIHSKDLPALLRQVERATDRPAAQTRDGIPRSDMNRREFITLRSDAADPAWGWMSLSWLAVVIGCLYILSARLSLSLLTPTGVAVFWPAAGVAAGVLIAFGARGRWGGVIWAMVATIVGNLPGGRKLWSSIVFAPFHAGGAGLTAWLIERYFGWPCSLDRLSHVLGLLAAAIVATAVSGIGGTLGFALFHDTSASIFATWQEWFASDALGIVTIAPLVIGLASAAREPPAQS